MSQGFAKLYSSILTSSIWEEDPAVLKAFLAMLVSCDARGWLPLSSTKALARIANLTEEQAASALEILERPDPDSRSEEADGRRIIRERSGIQIVNLPKYRKGDPNSSGAERTRRYRARLEKEPSRPDGDASQTSQAVTSVTSRHLASASASEIEKMPDDQPDPPGPCPDRLFSADVYRELSRLSGISEPDIRAAEIEFRTYWRTERPLEALSRAQWRSKFRRHLDRQDSRGLVRGHSRPGKGQPTFDGGL